MKCSKLFWHLNRSEILTLEYFERKKRDQEREKILLRLSYVSTKKKALRVSSSVFRRIAKINKPFTI